MILFAIGIFFHIEILKVEEAYDMKISILFDFYRNSSMTSDFQS